METIALAAQNIFSMSGLLFLCLGVLIGFIFGAIPGVGGTTALAMLIPVTFSMSAQDAILLLGGVMGAGSFGGSITSILINTPGTSSNAATCLDGYPMARNGRAGEAIGAAALSSSIGGLIGIGVLIIILPFAKNLILMFGAAELFLIGVLGLVAVALSTGSNLIRGLIAATAGLLLATVGYDDISGRQRFTFGVSYLWDGISIIPALIGLFAIAEMIKLTIEGVSISNAKNIQINGLRSGFSSVLKNKFILLQGSIVGTVVGIIPGVGGTVAGFLSYTVASQSTKDSDNFGKGDVRGVIAPEAANNAKDGGSMLPTLAFGIPGSAETAIFLGALIIHGIQPGPMLLINNEYIIFGLVIALSLSCILASLIGILLSGKLAIVTRINVYYLVPIILFLSFVGTYSVQRSIGDVFLALIFGFIGFLMIKFNYPRITLIIGLVLGGMIERTFHQSLMISRGDYSIFYSSLISKSLILFISIAAVLVLYKNWRASKNV